MQPKLTRTYLESQGLSETFPARFVSKIRKTPGCWFWIGSRDRAGYGRINMVQMRQVPILAHRASWMLHRGPIPVGLCVLHKCDNPSCVNPKHLKLGTHKSNSDDKWRKGRSKTGHLYGEAHPAAVLTWSAVAVIRLAHPSGVSIRRLSQFFSVSIRVIQFVLRLDTWKPWKVGRRVLPHPAT